MYCVFQDNDVIKKKDHQCEMDTAKNILLKEKNALKRKAVDTDIPIPKIYKRAKIGMTEQGLNFVTEIPRFSNLKSGLYNARNKAVGTKKTVFKNLKEVEVPKKFYDLTLSDYNDGTTRIILFCSEESRALIRETKEFFVDATFHSCPKPFYQLLSIHGDFGSTEFLINTRPLIYALMPNKKQISYDIVFQMIKSQLPELEINLIHCDFEIAMWNAILKVYPNTNIKGCYYHWNRNMWRMGKKLEHKRKDEKRIVGLCATLPLLPKELIIKGWQYIRSEYESIHLKMPKFVAYVGRLLKKPHDNISVFGLRHRTNNVLESFHSALNKCLNKNVTLLRLLNVIVDNEKLTETKIPNKRKNQYIIRDDAIRQTMLQCVTGEISIGHALEKLR